MVSVLLLGATGFLGGTVMTDLEAADYDITALVRPGKEDKLSSRKAKVETGDFSQLDEIEQLSGTHDAVINAATSDDLDLTKAINRGLAKGRRDGKKGVLVHISGTQLIESSKGSGCWEEVPKYDIKGISDKALHRYIDLEVERADLAEEIIASIICPGLIYGVGTGPDKVVSDLNPDFVRKALKAKQVVYAGDGTNEWADVHVQDVADLILLSLEHNLAASTSAGFERFYFAENGSHNKLALAKDIADIMHSHKLIPSTDLRSVPADSEEAPNWANRTTCRCVGSRSRKDLGWTPKFKMSDVLAEDVLATARAEGIAQ